MHFNFKGKTVLVTASSKGIGYELAKQFLILNANVCICSRNEDNPSASTLISDEVLQMMSGRSSRQSCRDEREMVRVRCI